MPELVDDRYELLDVIASGGMATVWRARDRRLGRDVAVKRPHPAPPDDPLHARIEREARAAASLNHPNLVTVFDAGRDGEGPFLVMELVEGPSLSTQGRGMDRDEAIETCALLADALGAVHAAGIVHRDVKPSNILISDRGPLLTDFGIALDGDVTSQLTRTGTVIGTADYAAPEQLAGDPPSPKSDVFSLGVILHELIAGQLPFSGADRRTAAEPLGDSHLDPVLSRVLAVEPTERPDADTLAASLRSAATTTTMPVGRGSTMPLGMTRGEKAPPRPAEEAAPSRPSRVAEPDRLLRWLLAALAIVVLVVAGLALIPSVDPSDVPLSDTADTSSAPSTAGPVTTSPATTAVTTAPPTTSASDVAEARSALEASLTRAHPQDMNPSDLRGQMERADRAISAAAAGDEEAAGNELREIAKMIDEKLEGEVHQESLESLVDLADALGISLDG
ncbi:MAG TPA: serine/threonine-protein kinase [Acidimicrobiia bacterium]|nr:serine/threonine-protein kinase [Acidimicrobiia bacterium]